MPKKKEKVKNIFSSPFLRIILIILVIWLLFYISRELYWYFENKKELEKLQEEQRALIQENETLEEKLEEVGSPEFIEEQARQQFGFQKPGEKVIIVVPEEND